MSGKEVAWLVLAMCTILILAMILMINLGLEAKRNSGKTNPGEYKETLYTLSDGTPCTIVRVGNQGVMVGVTCNYK